MTDVQWFFVLVWFILVPWFCFHLVALVVRCFFPTTRHTRLWYLFSALAHDLDPPKVHERTSHSHAVGLPNEFGWEEWEGCEVQNGKMVWGWSDVVYTLGLAVWPSQFHAASAIFIAVITILSHWLYGSPMTFKNPPSFTTASLHSVHLPSNTWLCSWGLLSQCLNPLKGTAYIFGTSSLGRIFFCHVLCDSRRFVIVTLCCSKTHFGLHCCTKDQTVDFLQEDNICYRAMPGKKLLIDRSQFSASDGSFSPRRGKMKKNKRI